MSCYNWESGTIKFSVKEFLKFRSAFRAGFNRFQEQDLAEAIQHWTRYKTGPIPKRFESDRFDEAKIQFHFLWQKFVVTNKETGVGHWEARPRPRKPIRKDFPLATSRTPFYHFARWVSTAVVEFTTKTREVEYASGEGNHAVEEARESEVGKLFFRLLKRIVWTRGTGGKFIGNDENNQSQGGEGQAGNYVTARYEPKRSEPGTLGMQSMFSGL